MSIKILAVFVIVVGLAAAIAAPGLVSQRLQNNVQRDGRVYLMKSAVQIIEEKPLAGINAKNGQPKSGKVTLNLPEGFGNKTLQPVSA